MGPNYYVPGYHSLKTPEQLNQEYAQIMQQYQNMYRNLNGNATSNINNMNYNSYNNQQTAVSTSGDYKIVEKYSEVENTPTRLDGTASLFFDFDNMVFWSKKFINGQHAVQAYKFMPINNADNTTPTTNSLQETTIQTPIEEPNKIEQLLEDLLIRVKALEDSKPKVGRPPKKVEGDLINESK